MPLDMMVKPVVVEDVVEHEDGRLTVTVTFSWYKADQLKEVGGDDLRPLLTRLIGKVVARLPGQPRRIVAHVSRDLLERFDKYCEARGVTRSRALRARISHYVDDDGDLLKKSYSNKMQIPDDLSDESKKKIVQIIAPDEQVKGFDSFCKRHSLNKDGFIVREMLLLLEPPPKAQQAEVGTPGS